MSPQERPALHHQPPKGCNVIKLSKEARKLLPPSPREVAPKGSVGVSKVRHGNPFKRICEGTSSQTAIQSYVLSYLRHYRPAVGISDL